MEAENRKTTHLILVDNSSITLEILSKNKLY